MKNEVVTFQQALDLCALGFNEVTCCGYLIENRELYLCDLDNEEFYKPEKDLHAPLKQQVFKWFREKYFYLYKIHKCAPNRFSYSYENKYGFHVYKDNFKTYEEAESACIDKLIELVKNQKS